MRLEIRWHGRGGQGAVTAAQILAAAAIEEGLWAQAFPEFGAERRGAPVKAYTRIATEPILEREPILEPNVVVVLDSTLDPKVYLDGLREEGAVIINTGKSVEEIRSLFREKGLKEPKVVAVVNATSIAMRFLKAPIVNTAMLGAFVKAVGVIKLDTIFRLVAEKFKDKGSKVVDANITAIREAYEATRVG
ncbi:MAG TPA: pyruvate synthase [Pyrodictium sp.]|nr:pyruvate synthase [Pyrodictium sp.]